MAKIRILNTYGGIGGNRKLWKDVEVTAVEINPEIAKIYQELFPEDTVIVGDAHKYLLKHFKEFDFIWSSPPCPTHSDIRRCGVHAGRYPVMYPDMKLYQEIIMLRHFAKCKWVVENVKPYYDLLIPGKLIERHIFWSNFVIPDISYNDNRVHNDIVGSKEIYGFDISQTNILNKRAVLRNLVNPQLGLHIFNCAFKEKQQTLKIKGFI